MQPIGKQTKPGDTIQPAVAVPENNKGIRQREEKQAISSTLSD